MKYDIFSYNILYLGSGGKEMDILLLTPPSVVSHIEDIRNTLINPSPVAMERSCHHEFVCQYKNPDFYLSRCFPTLYPYGRGCPSDKWCRTTSIAKYVKHMLCLGGGPCPRRFQQSSQFIFSVYNFEMKRKIGGVAFIAQKKNFDGSPDVLEEAPSISDMNNLLHYLNPATSSDLRSVSSGNVKISANNKHDEQEMQRLIRRLVPYSQSLQGTAPHIAHERTKLMAMIPSPIINKFGLWRLFFTVAPADLYESRFFEVVYSPITDSTAEFWAERSEKVRSFNLFLYS